jgi:beta-hydroxylase
MLKVVYGLLFLFIIANIIDVIASKRSLFAQSAFQFAIAPFNAATHLSTPSWLKREIDVSPILKPSVSLFPHVNELRAAFDTLRQEGELAFFASKPIKHDQFFQGISDDGWKRFYLKWYGPPDPKALQVCPETCALLQRMPEVHLAMFSILLPKSKIKLHHGPARMCLRYHMGIITPNDDACNIKIGEHTYSWRDGEDVMFDDTHYHEVTNDTNSPRIILFLDVERPQIGPMKFISNSMIQMGAMTTRGNDETAVSL